MSHPLCYTIRMKMIMKEQMKTQKANNLILGAIYINATTGQPCRLVNIVSCQGVWLETFDGQGYGETVSFDDCHYASQDEVTDFLNDLNVYQANEKAPSHKGELPPVPAVIRIKNYDTMWNVQGYYNDDNGNDIRCRD